MSNTGESQCEKREIGLEVSLSNLKSSPVRDGTHSCDISIKGHSKWPG